MYRFSTDNMIDPAIPRSAILTVEEGLFHLCDSERPLWHKTIERTVARNGFFNLGFFSYHSEEPHLKAPEFIGELMTFLKSNPKIETLFFAIGDELLQCYRGRIDLMIWIWEYSKLVGSGRIFSPIGLIEELCTPAPTL